MHEKLRKAAALYRYFFRIGWYTFGGGWSIVAQIEQDFVGEKISSEELLDMVSVGRSLPGLMIGNVAYLFGCHQGGTLGGVLSVLGISTPPLIILAFLTAAYGAVRDNIWVEWMLRGVRCVVAPIILSTVWKLGKTAFPKRVCYLLCVLAFMASGIFRLNNAAVVLLGAAAGLLLGRMDRGEDGAQ